MTLLGVLASWWVDIQKNMQKSFIQYSFRKSFSETSHNFQNLMDASGTGCCAFPGEAAALWSPGLAQGRAVGQPSRAGGFAGPCQAEEHTFHHIFKRPLSLT